MSATLTQRDAQTPARTTTRRGTRRLAILAAIAVVVAGAAYYGYGWYLSGRFIQTTDDAYVGGNVTTIAPHIAGFVTDILVADNEHVQRGQLLARLDPRDTQAAYDRAHATLEAHEAALANLRARLVLQQSAIRQATADQTGKTANAQFTRIDSARYALLGTTNAVTRQDQQKTAAAMQVAQAELAASQAGLEAARQQLAVLNTQITQAQADIAGAQADQRAAALNLSYTDIRAPIEGFVGNRAAQIGAYVAPGGYLLSIIPAHGMWIDANFKEDQLAAMAPGQPVTATADAAPGRLFHGRVLSLAPGTGALFSVIPPENATGNFTKIVQRVPVRIALDADDASLGRLRPGMSILVSVDTKAAP
jgi:membrane fusion protein (multidrug efflux system)